LSKLQLFTSGPRAIIFNQDNKILICYRKDTQIGELPGGGQERSKGKAETVDEALIREVKEETGLQIQVKKLFAMYEEFSTYEFDKDNDPVHTIASFWLCEKVNGKIKNNSPKEIHQLQWLSQKQIEEKIEQGKFIKRQALILQNFFKGNWGVFITRNNRVI